MRPLAILAALACSALLLLAGCGSSESSSGTSSGTNTATTSSTHTSSTSSTASGGLKADTTPKFASPSSSEPARTGTVQIAYRNIAIDPDTVRAKVGSTARWTNEDPERCNVTSEGGPYKFASHNFGEGQSFELKLTKPGTIHYECTYYPATMNGTIEVVE